MKRLLFLLFSTALLTSCADKPTADNTPAAPAPTSAPPQPAAPSGGTFQLFELDSSKIQFTKSGLQYQIVQKGNGEIPQQGQTVIAHYHGTLLDGTTFDSSFERGQPFQFPLGQGRVIRGWDEGFALFPVGTKAILIIPPDLGYGERGSPPKIPPQATLRFDVELLGIAAAQQRPQPASQPFR